MNIPRSITMATAALCALAGAARAQNGRQPERPDDPYRAAPAPVRTSAPAVNGPHTRGGFVSVQVNVDANHMNILGDAANEPSIAVDPTNPMRMVIGWRQFDTVTSNFRQAGYGYTRDGGAHWTFPGRIQPGVFRSDPVLEADRSGNFFYNSLQSNFTIQIFKSTDGGVTWPTQTSAFGGDKQWMVIDKTGGLGDGNIYEDWSTCCGNYPNTTFSRSVNRGASFQTPMAIPGPTTGGTLAVAPDGTLYTFGNSNGGFRVDKSTNAKDPAVTPTFSSVIVNIGAGGTGFDPNHDPNPGGGEGQYWIDIDRTPAGSPTHGNLYVLGSVTHTNNDPLDVMFARSTDGGQTWSTPVRVNNDTEAATHWQWFATMSVAPSGRIDAIWNDSRNSNQSNIVELFYAWSTDAGVTWQGNIPITAPWNSYIGWPQQNKIGDYYDMESDIYGADLAYAATFNGEQDVYYLRLGRPKCPQDVNRDGAVNVQDFLAFLQNYSAGASAADFNGSGNVDVQDFLAFLAAYAAGCP
jgi:hypothetical protein